MYDETNGFRAELIDCSSATETLEGLGEVTAIVKTGADAEINIFHADTQGSLEDIFSSHGDYFMIGYYGSFPDISYGYHLDGEAVDDILSIRKRGDLFADFKFNPNDDLITGTISNPIVLGIVTGENPIKTFEGATVERLTVAVIQLLEGENERGDKVFDIVSFVDGRRMFIARSTIDAVAYGTLRKKISIKLADTTRVASFSFGNLPTDASDRYAAENRAEPDIIIEMVKKYQYRHHVGNLNLMNKMTQAPNKIYNTQGVI